MGTDSKILKFLNVRQGEGKAVILLILYSFFMGLSLAFFFTSTNAIFLTFFDPVMIPVSFIASGVAVYLAWLLLSLIDKHLTVSGQLIFKLLFVTVSVILISIGEKMAESGWLAFLMYTWVRVIVYISLVTFWGVAAKLFDLRQGKRIFGLISTGEVISLVVGYFSIPFLLEFLKTPDLLFLAAFSLIICVIVVFFIIKNFKEKLEPVKLPAENSQSAKKPKESWKYLDLIKKPYFLYISLMALLPIFGYLFIDFTFLYQTKFEFHNDQQLVAKFLGIFLGFVALFELLLKVFVSGRLLTQYGIRISLLSLPVVLLISIGCAAFFGSIFGAASIFFVFIVFARLLERSFRGAIYDPAFQILYQPMPPDQRLAFQSQIEGIPKALGTVITGVVILALSALSFLNLVHYSYVFVIVLIIWLRVTLRMYKEYRNRLKHIISGEDLMIFEPGEESQTLDKTPVYSIIETSKSGLEEKLSMIENIEPNLVDDILIELLQNGAKQIRLTALDYIEEYCYLSALPAIDKLIKNRGDEEFNQALLKTRKELLLVGGYPIEHLESLSKSKYTEDRVIAARLLGYSGRYNAFSILSCLLSDNDPKVIKTSLISAGRLKRIELWPAVFEFLQHQEYARFAENALLEIGEPIIEESESYFWKMTNHKPTQLRIIRLMEKIGGKAAIQLLKNKLNYPDKDVRYQTLLSLSRLEYKVLPSETPVLKETLKQLIGGIIWLLASIIDLEKQSGSTLVLRNALKEEIHLKKENVFILLSLLYDAEIIRQVREHLEKGSNQSRVFALEICDIIITQEMKDLFIPIFEDITPQETIQHFRYIFPQQQLDIYERLLEITNKDIYIVNPVIKALAIFLLPEFEQNQRTTSSLLAANMPNPDPLIKETACMIFFQNYREQYFNTLNRFSGKELKKLNEVTDRIKDIEKNSLFSLLDEILLLKKNTLFASIPAPGLIDLVFNSKQEVVQKNAGMEQDFLNSDYLAILASGRIILKSETGFEKDYFPGDILPAGFIFKHEVSPVFKAESKSSIIFIENSKIFDLMDTDNKLFDKYFSLGLVKK